MASPIPYPAMSEDHALQVQVARYEEIVSMLEPGDVLSVVDNLIADEPDPRTHPAYALVTYYLNHRGTDTGTKPNGLLLAAERLDTLVKHAIDRLAAQYLVED